MEGQIHLRLWSVFIALGLTVFFLLQDSSFAFADDHHFGGGGSRGPMKSGAAIVISFAYAAIFGACFVGLFFIHAWLAGIAIKLGWLLGLFAPLGWLLFVAGITAPVGLWAFFVAVMLDGGPSLQEGYEPYVLTLGCFLVSILYHYALCVFLSLLSPHAWGETIWRTYCVLLCAVAILALVAGSLLVLLLFLALCLGAHWIACTIYRRREDRLQAKHIILEGTK